MCVCEMMSSWAHIALHIFPAGNATCNAKSRTTSQIIQNTKEKNTTAFYVYSLCRPLVSMGIRHMPTKAARMSTAER